MAERTSCTAQTPRGNSAMAYKNKKNGKSKQKWKTCSCQKKGGGVEGDTDVSMGHTGLFFCLCLIVKIKMLAQTVQNAKKIN